MDSWEPVYFDLVSVQVFQNHFSQYKSANYVEEVRLFFLLPESE